jgi:hypothetical protein
VSRNRYLSFFIVLSSLLTDYAIQSLDYRFDASKLPLLFIISVLYGINGPISAWAAKKASKQRIALKFFCPNCGRKIKKTRNVCPYCRTNLVHELLMMVHELTKCLRNPTRNLIEEIL